MENARVVQGELHLCGRSRHGIMPQVLDHVSLTTKACVTRTTKRRKIRKKKGGRRADEARGKKSKK